MKDDKHERITRGVSLKLTSSEHRAIREHAEQLQAKIGSGMRVTWQAAARNLLAIGLECLKNHKGSEEEGQP